MKWTVVVPGALLTEHAPHTGSGLRSGLELLPDVRARLARAERQPDLTLPPSADGAAAAWLWQRFGGTGAPKLAPYAWHAIHGKA